MVGLIPNVKECPLYDKGRWYRFIFENSSDDYELVSGDDLEVTAASKKITFPENFVVTDYKIDWPSVSDSANTCALTIGHLSGNKMTVAIPAAANITTLTVYVYGYFNSVE